MSSGNSHLSFSSYFFTKNCHLLRSVSSLRPQITLSQVLMHTSKVCIKKINILCKIRKVFCMMFQTLLATRNLINNLLGFLGNHHVCFGSFARLANLTCKWFPSIMDFLWLINWTINEFKICILAINNY